MSRLLGGVISELVLILLNIDFEIDRSWKNLERFLNNIYIPTRAKYYSHSNSCLCWALLRDVSIWVLKIFWKWFAYLAQPLRRLATLWVGSGRDLTTTLLSQFTRVSLVRKSVETGRSSRPATWMAARQSINSKPTQLSRWKIPSTSI
jgi:hypothetical protein